MAQLRHDVDRPLDVVLRLGVEQISERNSEPNHPSRRLQYLSDPIFIDYTPAQSDLHQQRSQTPDYCQHLHPQTNIFEVGLSDNRHEEMPASNVLSYCRPGSRHSGQPSPDVVPLVLG